jgi:multiple antibiotic resistance protein
MLEDVLSSLIRLTIIIDPFTTLALFLSLTQGMSTRERRGITRKAAIASAIFLLCFGLGGNVLLDYMGITIESMIIAGGVLLAIMGIEMLLHGIQVGSRVNRLGESEDIAIVPLAIPSIADPGSIALVMVMSNRMEWYWIVFIVLIAIGICAMALLFAERIYKALGEEGSKALTRVMGLLTVAFAVQYILDGVGGWIATLL